MIILTIRTDNPHTELGLYQIEKAVRGRTSHIEEVAYIQWEAHRALTATIHKKLRELLDSSSKLASDLNGIVCYKGPGSFTGLRIGLSVANALAYSYKIPIVAVNGKNWIHDGLEALRSGKDDQVALPMYNRPAATTKPSK